MGQLLGSFVGEEAAAAAGEDIASSALGAVTNSSISPMLGMQLQAFDMFNQMFTGEQGRIGMAAPTPGTGTATPAPAPTTEAPAPAKEYTGDKIKVTGPGGYAYMTEEEARDKGYTPWEYADGGVVTNTLQRMFPDNMFQRTRERREQEAGTQAGNGGGITINLNTSAPAPTPAPAPTQASGEDVWAAMLAEAKARKSRGAYADGTTAAEPRSVKEDIRKGGKIGGPQSKSGRDNQFIKVAGGEGIIPVDVMQVPGVEELVRGLITHFHVPVEK